MPAFPLAVRMLPSGLLAMLLTIACPGLAAAQGAPPAAARRASAAPAAEGRAAAAVPADEVPPLSSLIGRQVAAVRLERSGQPLNDPRIAALVETRPGGPLSMREVRNSLLHLFNTGLFDDIDVAAEPAPTPAPTLSRTERAAPAPAPTPSRTERALGAPAEAQAITLVYRLTPARTIGRYEFRGVRGVSDDALRRVLVDHYGQRPAAGRVQDASAALEQFYRDAGFINAHVTTSVEPMPSSTGSSTAGAALVVTVASGPRARVGTIELRGSLIDPKEVFLNRLDLKQGEEFDGTSFPRRIERVQQDMRNRGYYEATVTPLRVVRDDGRTVDLTIDVVPGPRVTLKFEGGSIPSARQEELVPVRREGSIDEDLLEDSKRRIEDYLKRTGHWKAVVSYARLPTPAGLDLVFTLHEGPVFHVADVQIEGNQAMTRAEIDTVFTVHPGDLFVEPNVDGRALALRDRYRRLGFRSAEVAETQIPRSQPPPNLLTGKPPASQPGSQPGGQPGNQQTGEPPLPPIKEDASEAWVDVHLAIKEGPQTRVNSVAIAGAHAIDVSVLRGAMTLKPGAPFFEPQIAADRTAIETQYLNRGFQGVHVEEVTAFSTDGATADLAYTIREGLQQFIDHIVIVGNHRTDTATIERTLTIQSGQPLSLSDLFESQRRLSALGLFRRVRLTDVGEPGESRRDVIVSVEEAPTTTLGYGAGLEAGRRITSSGSTVAGPQEALDFAGRGFVELGRRNLFGSNRSATVFLRGTLRPRDQPNTPNSNVGINEYRVLTTLRDPSVLGTTIDGQIQGYFEQAIRSSFNFRRRGIQAVATKRLRDRWTLSGTYSFNHTELFDQQISPSDQLDIDRLFPQVRLSIFSTAARRDTRDDALDPTRGTVIGFEGDLAARRIGSQVGFVKEFGEVFWYRQLPAVRHAVFASGARIGLARGFERVATRLNETGQVVAGPDGQPVFDTVTDLPASERFFAGGDTTVRGFARDTLGDLATLDSRGFPRGGNALIILNAELRMPVAGDFGSVFFMDAGNIFSRVDEVDLTRLRPTAGFGVRYKSPVGPIRVDIGFKLDRSRFATIGRTEPLSEIHVSIGQAF